MAVLRSRGLLFDLDGVFVDSTESVERHWRAFAERYGIDADDLLTRVHGFPQPAIIKRELSDRPDEIDDAIAFHTKIEEDDASNDKALPGATSMASALPQDRWAVVTSGWRRIAELRAGAAGVSLPPALVTADQIERGKPDPQAYLRGAELLGVDASDCVVIEDAPTGIKAGNAAGARVIALRTTHDDSELGEAAAIVDNLESIRVEFEDGKFILHLDE
jgi:mannitol-1-/sugar-/sorbitol-6-phosphatase